MSQEVAGDVEYSQHPLDLADIPPDLLSLGQRIVEVTGPLDISYNSLPLLAFWTLLTLATPGPKRSAATWFLGAGTTYVMLLVVIFHCTLESFWFGVFLTPFMEMVRLLWKATGVILIMVDLIAAGVAILILGLWLGPCCLCLRGDRETRAAYKACSPQHEKAICFVVLFLVFIGYYLWLINRQWFDALRSNKSWVPDLGVAVSEQDQLAALIAASMSLCCTLYCTVRRIRTDPPGTEAGETVELHDSLFPERDSHDVEALAGARRVSTM